MTIIVVSHIQCTHIVGTMFSYSHREFVPVCVQCIGISSLVPYTKSSYNIMTPDFPHRAIHFQLYI